MKKLLLTGIAALFLVTGSAHRSGQAGYFGENRWSMTERMHEPFGKLALEALQRRGLASADRQGQGQGLTPTK
jgi:hypothetical protein